MIPSMAQRISLLLGKIQPDLLETALKELWQRKPTLYKSVIINAYLDEKIN